jgi:hypothetical protein
MSAETQPKKYCQKCGSLIPDNTEVLTAWDEACRLAKLRGTRAPDKPKKVYGHIACQNCALIASEGMPVRQKKRRRGVAEGQATFDVPTIAIR